MVDMTNGSFHIFKARTVLLWSATVLLVLALAAGFVAYLQPGLPLNFMTLRYCG